MKNRQLITERQQLMKIAGLVKEARTPSYGGTDTVPDFEFEANGKDYIAKITVDYYYDWDSEDGIYNYQQTVSIHELGAAKGDEYFDVTDRNEIANIESLLNTDAKLSSRIENLVDIDDADMGVDDSYDDYDLEEDSDYDMGTPSGDTDSMNIAEDDFSGTMRAVEDDPVV